MFPRGHALRPNRLIELIVAIDTNGYDQRRPVLVDQAGELADGHHRTAACALLGIDPPPVRHITR